MQDQVKITRPPPPLSTCVIYMTSSDSYDITTDSNDEYIKSQIQILHTVIISQRILVKCCDSLRLTMKVLVTSKAGFRLFVLKNIKI